MKDLLELVRQCQLELAPLRIPWGRVRNWSVNSRAKARWGLCTKVSRGVFDIQVAVAFLEDNLDDQPKATKNPAILLIYISCAAGGAIAKKQVVRPAFLCSEILLFGLTRSKSCLLFEKTGEIACVLKTAFFSNLEDGIIATQKIFLGIIDTKGIDVFKKQSNRKIILFSLKNTQTIIVCVFLAIYCYTTFLYCTSCAKNQADYELPLGFLLLLNYLALYCSLMIKSL